MPRYLIDVNLPRYFSLWNSPDYIHQNEIGSTHKDHQIWEYAAKNNLTIITKDSDFSNRVLLSQPSPKVIHIRLGNMEMKKLHEIISRCWEQVLEMSAQNKLVIVFENRIEAIK